jgi:hypothetical protein
MAWRKPLLMEVVVQRHRRDGSSRGLRARPSGLGGERRLGKRVACERSRALKLRSSHGNRSSECTWSRNDFRIDKNDGVGLEFDDFQRPKCRSFAGVE